MNAFNLKIIQWSGHYKSISFSNKTSYIIHPLFLIVLWCEQVRGMFLNLLICSTFCAFMHITLWPWNQQTGFLLEDMLCNGYWVFWATLELVQEKPFRNVYSTNSGLQHNFFCSTNPLLPGCGMYQHTYPQRVLCSPQLQLCQGGSTSISGISSASAAIPSKPHKSSFWIH